MSATSGTAQQPAQAQEQVSGPPAWALGVALVVSGNIFEFWALRAPAPGPTIILALIALVVRVVGLGVLIRWTLAFQTWWAYVIAVILAAGIVTAFVDVLSH